MKLVLIFTLFATALASAQSTDIYEIEYDNGTQMFGMAFDVEQCSEQVITSNWKDWIKSRSGKISIMNNIIGKNQATDVHFSRDVYHLNFDVLPRENDTLIVVNVFQFPNGEYLTKSSHPQQYNALQSTMQEFAYQTKKACVRDELENANQYQAKLNDQYIKLQRDKTNLEKQILRNQNKILKLTNKNRVLQENLDNYPIALERETNPKKINKINNKLNRDQQYLSNNIQDIKTYQTQNEQSKQSIGLLETQITNKEKELDLQQGVIEKITTKFNQIQR